MNLTKNRRNTALLSLAIIAIIAIALWWQNMLSPGLLALFLVTLSAVVIAINVIFDKSQQKTTK